MKRGTVIGLTLGMLVIAGDVAAARRSRDTAEPPTTTTTAEAQATPVATPPTPPAQPAVAAAKVEAPVAATTPATPNAAAKVETNGEPLVLRNAKPLQLAEMPKATPYDGGVKLLGGALIIAAAFAFVKLRKKKSASGRAAMPAQTMRIVRRMSLGMRNELLVVDVDGQRLLLGSTPQSVQLVTTLGEVDAAPQGRSDRHDDHEEELPPMRARANSHYDDQEIDDHRPLHRAANGNIPRDNPNQGARFAALMRATGVTADSEPPSASRRAMRPGARASVTNEHLEGQVRSLATWGPRR